MSKEELSKYKYKRQQPAINKPSNGTQRKVRKPWILERKYIGEDKQTFLVKYFGNDGTFKKCKAYATEEGAKQALEATKSGFFNEKNFEFRIVYNG